MIQNSETIREKAFWSMPSHEVAAILETHIENGLSGDEARKRLQIFGQNVIEKPRKSPGLLILLNQFKSPLILILVFASLVTLFIGHYRDAFFILAAVVANVILGFYQEFKAERALAELKTYLKQRARVIRGGVEFEIDAASLVPGDIVRLTQGDRVPADGRLVFVNDLQIDEAVLTGESLPVVKSIPAVSEKAILGDQHSMAFAGTLVTQGVGTVIICRTDFFTELGKIASLVAESQREETPLQTAIRKFSLRMGLVLIILTILIFGFGVVAGHSIAEMFLISVAVAVSAMPEGLPVAMTVVLAIGVERMAKRKGVIRKLIAAEALGGTTVILTDKTGTLTMAKMELGQIIPAGGIDEKRLLELALINTNVLIENKADPVLEWRMNGRVIESSLVRSAARRGVLADEVKSKVSILNSSPFNAVNKYSAVLIRMHGKHLLVFFGAPDIFINNSTLGEVEKKEALKKVHSLAIAGGLVVGVATKEIEPIPDFTFSRDLKFNRLSFDGLITLHDPIRPNVGEAVAKVEQAGIKTIILTGDHKGTAEAVAREVGMHIGEHGVLDISELANLSDEELKVRLPLVRVISRVSPFDKTRIVRVLQEMGEVVAMTGDGVNDAPSIKQANIGIAMGSGTEVAREVADLVLLDDNFETIVAAIEEGRQIMHNIRKVLVYLLSSVADELLLIGGVLLVGLPLPINALQILWVNFFSDSFPAVAFAFERNIDGMTHRPHNVSGGLFTPLMNFLILFIGLSSSVALFIMYWVLLRLGFDSGIVRTFIFASFGTYTLLSTFSLRSLHNSIFSYRVFSNHYLVWGVVIGLVLMGAAIYVPAFQAVFDTVALPPLWVFGVVLFGGLNIIAVEFGKWFFRHKEVM